MKLIFSPDPASFEIIADTALVTPGKPTFVPDVPGCASWAERMCMAVRISRLGKTIAPRFVERYIDGITLASRIYPIDGTGKIMSGRASAIDCGVTLGNWTPISEENLTIEANGLHTEVDRPVELINSSIASLTEALTVKTGDILLLPLDIPLRPINIGDRSQATLGDTEVLNVRFK